MFILIKTTLQSGLMQEALMANPYETLNVATALDRALKVSNKHKFEYVFDTLLYYVVHCKHISNKLILFKGN